MNPRILIVDHYDSFSYNLMHLFQEAGAVVTVHKCDKIDPSQTRPESYDGILLSPGPGNIENFSDIGNSRALLKKWQGKIPFLGVCLGHQLIAHYCGGIVEASSPAHGKKDFLQITNDSQLLKNIPKNSLIMRYHSQVISHENFPCILTITAETKDKTIMAFENKNEKLYGVQFHPESIGTPLGSIIAKNFLEICTQKH